MLSKQEPTEFPSRVLISVTGLSPQVITETLYALVVKRQPAFVPTEIHLLTTREGAERARLALLDPKKGQFFAFCQHYNIDQKQITFSTEQIHVLEDADGEMLDDIRTESDNQQAADFITSHIARMTADPDASLHVSIAGGRKTMGFYVGYALSLYGREQDRLSHILVSTPFESEPQFYYPPPEAEVIHLARENRPASTDDAEITLAEIPFVRLRHGAPQSQEDHSFKETIAHVQDRLGPPRLEFRSDDKTLWAGGKLVEIKPVDAAYYLWLAKRVVQGKPPVHWSEIGPEPFLATYRLLVSNFSGDYERTEKALLRDGMSGNFTSERKSRVQKALRQSLGWDEATPYLVTNYGHRPRTKHGLKLFPDQIVICQHG